MQEQQVIEKYILEHIPISKALGIRLEFGKNNEVIVAAPFANNINHKKTVFGGSLHAVATLACWGFAYKNLIDLLGSIEIVISHSEINYLLPVKSNFKAICEAPDEAVWKKFCFILDKKGKARIQLKAKIFQENDLAVNYVGTFVVLKTK